MQQPEATLASARHFVGVAKGGNVSSLGPKDQMPARPSSTAVTIALVLCTSINTQINQSKLLITISIAFTNCLFAEFRLYKLQSELRLMPSSFYRYADGTVTNDVVPQEVDKVGASEAYCECGEGWKCVISKVEGPDAGKGFSECSNGCTCVTDA